MSSLKILMKKLSKSRVKTDPTVDAQANQSS